MITEQNYAEIKQHVLSCYPACCTHTWVMEHLCSYLKKLPPGSKMLEMGTCVGGSARIFALANPNVTVHTVDLNEFENPNILHEQLVLFIQNQYNLPELTRSDLRSILRMNIEDIPNIVSHTGHSRSVSLTDVDFVFIDADHSYGEVQQDLLYSWEIVKDGGYICGDDVNSNSVYNAVNEFCIERDLSYLVYGKSFVIHKMPGKYVEQRMRWEWPNRGVFRNV